MYMLRAPVIRLRVGLLVGVLIGWLKCGQTLFVLFLGARSYVVYLMQYTFYLFCHDRQAGVRRRVEQAAANFAAEDSADEDSDESGSRLSAQGHYVQ